jgi:hypothetical protein
MIIVTIGTKDIKKIKKTISISTSKNWSKKIPKTIFQKKVVD